ncbi:unnamed protein product [Ectocarpus sp. 12 AP-2014]
MAGLLPGVAPAAFSGEFPARLSYRNTSNSGSIPSLSENFGNASAAAAAAVERGSGGGGGAQAGMHKKLLGPRPRGIGNASGVQAMEGVEGGHRCVGRAGAAAVTAFVVHACTRSCCSCRYCLVRS